LRIFSLLLVLVLPIYPSLSVLGSNGETDVVDYDESSIITAYDYDLPAIITDGGEPPAVNDAGSIRTTEADSTVAPKKNLKITNYTVQENDSYDAIAKRF
jgi:hypothetical protein